MRIFLYEWVTGGGLVEETGRLPQSLVSEGTAMLTALASDFSALPDTEVTVLRDIRLDAFSLRNCQVVEVHSASHRDEEIARLAGESDYTVIIAPETDHVLARTVAAARPYSKQILVASDEFIAATSDKDRTARFLSDASVPVPEAVRLESDEDKLPVDFTYPAVLKPVIGAGSQHTLLVSEYRDEPPPYPWPRRLERYCPGIAASVSFLCGPRGSTPLAACRQHLSADGRFTYLGGAILEDAALATRATDLARQALAALPPGWGFVGVDLVLGDSADGSEDVVIEVNPRLTTSYVGLRAATDTNLAGAIIDVVNGREPMLTFRPGPQEFHLSSSV